MITGELKNKIDALWDIFAAGVVAARITAVAFPAEDRRFCRPDFMLAMIS